jgi:hypothetical protein
MCSVIRVLVDGGGFPCASFKQSISRRKSSLNIHHVVRHVVLDLEMMRCRSIVTI